MFTLTLTCGGLETVGRGCAKAIVVGEMTYAHEVAMEARRMADGAGWHTVRLGRGGTVDLCPSCWAEWTELAERVGAHPPLRTTPGEIPATTGTHPSPDPAEVRTWLRQWAADAGNRRAARAAIYLLDWHDHWLNNRIFLDACVHTEPEDQWAWVDWEGARDAYDAGVFKVASTAELAVLNFAIAVGEDHYRLSAMGDQHAAALLTALARAAGWPANIWNQVPEEGAPTEQNALAGALIDRLADDPLNSRPDEIATYADRRDFAAEMKEQGIWHPGDEPDEPDGRASDFTGTASIEGTG